MSGVAGAGYEVLRMPGHADAAANLQSRRLAFPLPLRPRRCADAPVRREPLTDCAPCGHERRLSDRPRIHARSVVQVAVTATTDSRS